VNSSCDTERVIGIVTLGIASYLNPLLQLAPILTRQGYTVVFLSTSDVVASAANSAGYAFFQLKAAPSDACLADAKTAVQANWLPTRIRDQRIRASADQAWMRHGHGLAEFIQQYQPEIMLVMAELHEYIVFLAGHHAPLVVIDTHLATRRQPGIPPPHRAHIPGVGPFARCYSALQWSMLKQRRRLSRGWQRLKLGKPARISALQQLARELNLDARQFLDMSQWHFVDYPQLPLLRLANPRLNFSTAPEPGVFYTGALPGGAPAAGGPLQPDSDEWRGFSKAIHRAGRPLVYCSLGSFMSNGEFIRRVIKASKNQPWSLLLATGPDCQPSDLAPLPDNVAAFQWLPQWDVLDHAQAMLCAGGNATINECLFKGVPMLVYPIDRMDQYGMAARVQFHGLGLRGQQHDKPASIREKLAALLASGSIRASIDAMQVHFLADAGSGNAEAAVREAMQYAQSCQTNAEQR
jgi:UDP:flavonoid glycosyltransferase YjiC (YdhE family)